MVKLDGRRWSGGGQRLLAENDCFQSMLDAIHIFPILETLHFALKLVSLKFVGLGRAFPTFNLGFWGTLTVIPKRVSK